MNKMVCVLIFSLIIIASAFAQNNGPLRGKYNETSSIAQVGNQQLRYWLYRLPSHTTFDDIVAELCEYLENRYVLPSGSIGWPIYWDNVRVWNPNTNLAPGVKTMMTRLNRNVSVHIIQDNIPGYPPEGMYINYYNSTNDTFSTIYFPCYL